MVNLNTVILIGRSGNNPEIKYYESGKVFANFSLAVNRITKDSDGNNLTDWFRIELWGRKAEIANEYVKKGSLVGIVGNLRFKKWEDARGNAHETPYISANKLSLLGSKTDIVDPN